MKLPDFTCKRLISHGNLIHIGKYLQTVIQRLTGVILRVNHRAIASEISFTGTRQFHGQDSVQILLNNGGFPVTCAQF